MSDRIHLGEFELIVILALLRLGEDAYGVPISREIKRQCGREAAFGSVYATLDRLQKKGLVSSTLGPPTAERGGRAKRFFRITTKGIREVRSTQKTLTRMWDGLVALEGQRT